LKLSGLGLVGLDLRLRGGVNRLLGQGVLLQLKLEDRLLLSLQLLLL